MKWVLPVAAVVAGLAVITALLLPATTRSTVEVRFDAPIEAVWAVYADFESQPNWRAEYAQEAKAEIARRAADRSVEPSPPVESGAAAPELPLPHEEEQREAE